MIFGKCTQISLVYHILIKFQPKHPQHGNSTKTPPTLLILIIHCVSITPMCFFKVNLKVLSNYKLESNCFLIIFDLNKGISQFFQFF